MCKLGRRIVVKKKRLTDSWLSVIGQRQPSSLELVQCRGDAVTPTGLRELFRQCADSLQVMSRCRVLTWRDSDVIEWTSWYDSSFCLCRELPMIWKSEIVEAKARAECVRGSSGRGLRWRKVVYAVRDVYFDLWALKLSNQKHWVISTAADTSSLCRFFRIFILFYHLITLHTADVLVYFWHKYSTQKRIYLQKCK